VRGYSTNVTETCEEALNLIVDVQSEPATTADNTYLKEAVDNSEAVLGNPAREVSADGTYYSEENERYADKNIEAAACRRRTETLPRELFNRRCNVEATIVQLCYHTHKKKLKYRGKFRVQRWAICRVA
jgi:hypothetical protein